MNDNDITRLEERSLNAWPALRERLYDGWLLRFSAGYSRRANSVSLLRPAGLPLSAKVDACERVYAAAELPPLFKLTDRTTDQALDALLAERGYAVEAPTQVLVLPALPAAKPDPAVRLMPAPDPGWARAFCKLNGLEERHMTTMGRMFQRLAVPARFAAVQVVENPVALGLGGVDDGMLGLFDLVTDPNLRQNGLATRVVNALFAWGASEGAVSAYLQVLESNDVALAWYRRLGFRPAYRYWFRARR